MQRLLAGLMVLLCLPAHAAPTIDERVPRTLDSGRQLELVIRAPRDVEGRLPAIVLFGGFEGTAQILDYVQTERPVIRASFPYPWDAPDKVSLSNLPQILADFEQAVEDTFTGIALLTAHLRQRPDVDPERLVIVGASAGAPFATIAGQREAFPGIIIVQGFGDVGDVIARQFSLSLAKRYGDWVRPFTWLFAHFAVWWMDLPQPEDYAAQLLTSQQVLMVTAEADERIPASATETLWQAIEHSSARSTRLDLEGRHLRGYGDPAIDRIMARALHWLQRQDFVPLPD